MSDASAAGSEFLEVCSSAEDTDERVRGAQGGSRCHQEHQSIFLLSIRSLRNEHRANREDTRGPLHWYCHERYWMGEKMVQSQELRHHHTKGWRRGRLHGLPPK